MLICDLHCDLPAKIQNGADIFTGHCHWTTDKLKHDNTYIQIFAAFTDAHNCTDVFQNADAMLRKFKAVLQSANIPILTDCTCQADRNMAILAIEGGEALDGRLENIAYFYELGVRFITLTWNYTNELGIGASAGNGPLTDFGRAAIREMNRLHIIADVSHLCEAGFWDVLECSTRPVTATHSNAKSLCNHPRNLTDAQFTALKNTGGLVGINFYPLFLESASKQASIDSVLAHIEHFLALGGEDTIALGSDFDGINTTPKGLRHIGEMDHIAEAMRKRNYSETLIQKIMGQNALNFFKSNL